MINVHYAKRIRNPFTTSFSNADAPSSLEGISILLLHIDKIIRLSDLTRRYHRNIIYKLTCTEIFDTDR